MMKFLLMLLYLFNYYNSPAFGQNNSSDSEKAVMVLFVAPVKIDFEKSNSYSKQFTNTIRTELGKSSKYKLANPETDQAVEQAKNYNEQCKSLEECARAEARAVEADLVLISDITKIENHCRLTMRLENIYSKEILKTKNSRSSCSFDDMENKIVELIYMIMKNEEISGAGTRMARIDSNPAGAKITINNVVMEKKTPWEGKIPTGQVRILLEIDGTDRFAPILVSELVEESTQMFIYKKTFAERNAFLLIDVLPALAKIIIDGKPVSGESPLRIPVEVRREHELRVSAKKYQDGIFQIPSLEPDQEYKIFAKLKSNPCSFNITSNPSQAEVYKNGEYVGTTPYSESISPGDYKYQIRRQSYDAQLIDFYCEPEQIVQRAIILKRSKYTPEEQERIDSSEKKRTLSYYGFGIGLGFAGLSYLKFSEFKKLDDQYLNATDPFEIESIKSKRETAKNQSMSLAAGSIVSIGISYFLFKSGAFPEDLKQRNSEVAIIPSEAGTEVKWALYW